MADSTPIFIGSNQLINVQTIVDSNQGPVFRISSNPLGFLIDSRNFNDQVLPIYFETGSSKKPVYPDTHMLPFVRSGQADAQQAFYLGIGHLQLLYIFKTKDLSAVFANVDLRPLGLDIHSSNEGLIVGTATFRSTMVKGIGAVVNIGDRQ